MSENPIFERIQSEIDSTDVVLFMKGTPVFPQCGFSSTVVQVLTFMGIKFKGVDVLSDPEVREGIKEFSSWPTIPQLYVKGEFVGGCDIIREMAEQGEIIEFFTDKGIEVNIQSQDAE
ncbi:MAG: Grx4 family monothiol glutaredoxin [Rhodospirillaceae bacterium]|jgi:monothiol glutaredoxin